MEFQIFHSILPVEPLSLRSTSQLTNTHALQRSSKRRKPLQKIASVQAHMLSVWKSINQHGNDWPLALCDSRTIDSQSDSVIADVVFHNRFIENQRFYYSPKHTWYYFKDLEDSEVLLFRQTDSEIEGGGGEKSCF